MKELFMVLVVGLLMASVDSYGPSETKVVCEGKSLYLDCPRGNKILLLSANYGRTSSFICVSPNRTYTGINCVSTKAKDIIYKTCDNKMFCAVKASSAVLGGDPCPGVRKYIDVIFKCVSSVSRSKDVTTTPTLSTKSTTTQAQEITTQAQSNTTQAQEITKQAQSTTAQAQEITTQAPDGKYFDGTVIKPNETNVQESSKNSDHSFFQSMLVLVVLLKDKPRHSLLSMMIGIAAGAVIVLATVLVCVCLDKRRQKNESACFKDAEEGEAIELEKRELLERKKESNADSAKTDDQVDSAFCDDELDRRISNDYETTSDLAYLDAYLDEYNKNRSLPRPPVAGNDRLNSGQQRMSRRAHNDGSKGRSYDYNSNNENSYTTFS